MAGAWGEQCETAKNPVTSDPDIFRAAELLIDQHGENAPLRAAERADARLEAGDMIGAPRGCPESLASLCYD